MKCLLVPYFVACFFILKLAKSLQIGQIDKPANFTRLALFPSEVRYLIGIELLSIFLDRVSATF